ncbi:MAG: phosphate ABC transporter permease subunit PstC [Candidatus Eisenbacteria bacterium]|nr:phosphate ABC transporter permease subunit PstC [Candidatus Eisenbacteria bacterium]
MNDRRLIIDRFAGGVMRTLTVLSGLIVFLMILGLYLRSRPILADQSLLTLLTLTEWRPMAGKFGLLPFIAGTLWVTGVAVVIAVPLSILSAAYLSEYAHRAIKTAAKPLIDVLAGIPSVVYGVWGMLVVVPLIKDRIAPAFGSFSTGYSILAGGVVLAVMIIPVMVHVILEVFGTVPTEVRDASLAVGATRWQTVRNVVMRRAMPGVFAAIVLGLSRAFGETMAVLMVVGNVPIVPKSVLDPAYPLPALVANNYGEMMSVPLYDSALLLACLVLLLVVLFFNVISRSVLVRIERRTA